MRPTCVNLVILATRRSIQSLATSTDRASPPLSGMNARAAHLTYHDITLHYRVAFLPPHQFLSQHQQHLWRQLQARTFLTPARLSLFHPGTYSPACRLMWQLHRQLPTHILLLSGTLAPRPLGTSETRSSWEPALSSTRQDLKLRLVTSTEDVEAISTAVQMPQPAACMKAPTTLVFF
ncbi:hypothetical protein MRX96_022012 [Rhipicephalus microplus]